MAIREISSQRQQNPFKSTFYYDIKNNIFEKG